MQSSGDVVLDEVMLFEEPRIEGKLKWIERKAGKGHGTMLSLTSCDLIIIIIIIIIIGPTPRIFVKMLQR